MACLDANVLLGFVEGKLDGEALSETDAHLAVCGDCRELVATLARGTAPASTAAAVDLGEGERVGRYVLREQLGRGAMGVVYAAWDPELDRKVAIKLLRPDLGDHAWDVARGRLLREGRAIAQLQHPNVVAVHDVGDFDHRGAGGVFVAMELVDGAPVSAWRDTTRSPDEVIAVVEQAARGIAAAHRAGIVHRDVKPANLLVGNDGRVRVVDFGLAQRPDGAPLAAAAELDVEGGLTQTGVIVGTPLYMAPETMAGKPADEKADQYGLAATLYEVLAGVKPFTARTIAALEREKRHRLLAPPARRVPPRILAAIERGLAPEPDARWPSIDAFADRLARHLQRRRRFAVAATSAGGLAAIGAAIAMAVTRPAGGARCELGDDQLAATWNPARAAAVRARLGDGTGDRVVERFDAYAADWIAGYERICEATHVRGEQSEALLDLRMRCLDARRRGLDALATVLATRSDPTTRQSAITAAASLAAVADCDRGEALATIVPPPHHLRAQITAAEQAVDEAEALERAGQFADALAKLDAVKTPALGYRALDARAGLLRGELLHQLGRYADAEAALFAAAHAGAEARDDVAAARAWTLLVGVVGYLQGRSQEGLVLARMGDAAIARAGAADTLGADLDSMRGLVLDASGRLAESRVHHERALALRERMHGTDSLEVAQVLDNLGAIPLQQGKLAEAEQLYTRALAIRRRQLGEQHPDVAASWTALGSAQSARGAVDAARESYQSALAIWRAAFGDQHANVAAALNNLGMLERDGGKPGVAETHFTAAIATWRAVDASAHAADIATATGNLGLIAYDRGDHAAAAAKIGDAIALLETALGKDHPRLVNQLQNLARIELEAQRPREAEARFARALAIAEATLGASNPQLAGMLLGIGQARLHALDPAGAIAPLERVATLDGDVDPHERALASFTLARALWATGRDRVRARRLAEAARSDAAIAKDVDAWLARPR